MSQLLRIADIGTDTSARFRVQVKETLICKALMLCLAPCREELSHRELLPEDIGRDRWVVDVPKARDWVSVANFKVPLNVCVAVYGLQVDPRDSVMLQTIRCGNLRTVFALVNLHKLYIPRRATVNTNGVRTWQFEPTGYLNEPMVFLPENVIQIEAKAWDRGQCTLILEGHVVEPKGAIISE